MYSGRTTLYKHKSDNWREQVVTNNDNPGVKKVFMLDAQWSTCPVEVEEQVRGLWRAYELGNDHYMLKRSIKDLEEDHADNSPTDLIIQYLRECGVSDDDKVIIHWWW